MTTVFFLFLVHSALGLMATLPFVPERAKILPRRISGTCALHQRKLRVALMRARQLALIPYTAE